METLVMGYSQDIFELPPEPEKIRIKLPKKTLRRARRILARDAARKIQAHRQRVKAAVKRNK